MIDKYYYNSPIGTLELNLKNGKITNLKILNSHKKSSQKIGYFIEIAKQLDEYFTGKRKKFELNFSLIGTDFQKKVWQELLKIPYGETKSYQQIANLIKKPNAQRAVGSACNKNPILIIIPCHRVVSKNGSLKGFSCGIERKKELLKLEHQIQTIT